ncbi:MAG: pyridoxal phosphate-dependent aminotransferase [Gemmataceae bacterium]
MLSQFTQKITSCQPKFDFVKAHFQCEQNAYSRLNPNGYVNFGSAQNHLPREDLNRKLQAASLCSEDTKYQPFSGKQDTKEIVAAFLSRMSEHTVSPTNVVLGNGVISLLEALAFAILDEDDSVLVPTPVFPALVTALTFRTKANVSFLNTQPDDFLVTTEMVRQAIEQHQARGKRLKAILLCSPGNPVGQVFTQSELREIISLAEAANCALIIDEIYAQSCFNGVDFQSALAFDSDNVFVLGGLSKDFGLAGHAVAWLHGLHQQVMIAVNKQAHFYRLPAPVQTLTKSLLDGVWCSEFTRKNRSNLSTTFEVCRERFERMKVPVVPSWAGLCVWFDLRNYLSSPTFDGELNLYQYMLEQHRVHISPGNGFHCTTPGFYRICFTQTTDVLLEGLDRMENALRSLIPVG